MHCHLLGKGLCRGALKRCGIADLFEAVLTCTEAGFGKDTPHIFNMAHQLLGTDIDSTWVFEDSLYAARTAKQAGFMVCGVYDEYEKQQHTLKQLCDSFITSFDAVTLCKKS